jgi:hypothetical protein
MQSIIAVTGLAGHAIGSWTLQRNGNRMWLRDYLPEDVPNARILTYGYDSQLSGKSLASSTLQDLADEFMMNLLDMRDRTKSVRCLQAVDIAEMTNDCYTGRSTASCNQGTSPELLLMTK